MRNENLIRVLIADDYDVVREGLALLINKQKDMRVCWEAQNGEEALHLFRQYQPDVTLMDMRMPVMDGIKATQYICEEFPAASILALTASANPQEVNSVLRAGAKACLFKEIDASEIILAIRNVRTIAGIRPL